MIETLLVQRFHLKFHQFTKPGPVYLLTRGDKPLQLKQPKDPQVQPAALIFIIRGIADGQAAAKNVTMSFLARALSPDLGLPVLDRTGLQGSYDFHVPPVDPTNRDLTYAIFSAMDRLGLKLQKGEGPVETIVIDHVERLSPN